MKNNIMNKEQIIDEAYENYSKEYEKDNSIGMCLLVKRVDGKSTYRKPNKEMFVDLCTYDKTFSEKWGLKIEERELSHEERQKWVIENIDRVRNSDNSKHEANKYLYRGEPLIHGDTVPTKLITITYNGETIEIYGK